MPIGARTAVVLDEHPLWLEAIERLLARVGLTVVGKTTLVENALALIDEHRPDVLITELEFAAREVDALGHLRRAREVHPGLKVIVLSANDSPQRIEMALDAGATVYCVKKAEPDDLASAIRQTLDPSIYFAGAPRGSAAPEPAPEPRGDLPDLTRRELEILKLVAEGHSNSQLAQMLWVTEQTVKFHLSNIYRKLHVANRTEASRWAQLHGLLPAAEPRSAA